jgi:hypothetical protein
MDQKNLCRGKSPPADFVQPPVLLLLCEWIEDGISRYYRMRKLVVVFENINIE